MNDKIRSVEGKIGYCFRDKALLQTALTHSSYLNEHKDVTECNERLEFLGDSVLSLISSDLLFHTHSGDEGDLTKAKAVLVCQDALSTFARELDLGSDLILGKGERKTGSQDKDSVLCDEIEAILGAIYLDGGYDAAEAFILPLLKRGEQDFQPHDFKTRLQEVIQKSPNTAIRYQIVDEIGPEHDKIFCCHLILDGNKFSEGTGRSKKAAQQEAAKHALEIMGISI